MWKKLKHFMTGLRRLEEAFIKYSILQISRQYPEQFHDVAFSSTVEEILKEITPHYCEVFLRRYMGMSSTHRTIPGKRPLLHGASIQAEIVSLFKRPWVRVRDTIVILLLAHRCKFSGCGSVLVPDGNCKNSRRDVRAATEAGFIEYPSLPGSVIKTGCQLTPVRSSQYCYYHSPGISASLAVPDPESATNDTHPQPDPSQEVVKFLVAKGYKKSDILSHTN